MSCSADYRGFYLEAAPAVTGSAASGPLFVSTESTVRLVDPNGGVTVTGTNGDVSAILNFSLPLINGLYYPIVPISSTNANPAPLPFTSYLVPNTAATGYNIWQTGVTVTGSQVTLPVTGKYLLAVNLNYDGSALVSNILVTVIVTQTRGGVPEIIYASNLTLNAGQQIPTSGSAVGAVQAGDIIQGYIQYTLPQGNTLAIAGSITLQQTQ